MKSEHRSTAAPAAAPSHTTGKRTIRSRGSELAMESEYHVFLSHKGDDKPEVELLAARLKGEAGLRPFLDKWQLPVGKSWQPELERAIEQSASAAVFFGPHNTGPWHNEEIKLLLDAGYSIDTTCCRERF